MSNIYKIDLVFLAGVTISSAGSEAIIIARTLNRTVEFSFNGIKILVHPEMVTNDVLDAYQEGIDNYENN